LRNLFAFAAFGLAFAFGSAQAAAPTPEAEACRALGSASLAEALGEPDLKIQVARFNPAFGLTESSQIPANCELVGTLHARTGVDGQAYAIRFHLRMPAEWNGRFFFQGGSGFGGVMGDALGNLLGRQPLPALSLGYAVLSEDMGHENTANNQTAQGGALSFGHDPQARLDYAYASQALTTKIAKAIVQRHYGQAPRYSYFVGCGKGGQEGMAMSQRYPELFDGVLAGAPEFRPARLALSQAFEVQTLGRLTLKTRQTDPMGRPDLYRAFSNDDLALISFAVLSACDGLDGLEDGWIGAVSACTTEKVKPELSKITCADGQNGGCVSPEQIEALLTLQAGARDGQGKPLYAAWPWHAGFGGDGNPGWRLWKLGTGGGDEPNARNMDVGAGSLAAVFSSPPLVLADTPEAVSDFLMGYDLGSAALSDQADADSTDLKAFRKRGGKLILFHGGADPVASLDDTAAWFQALDRAEGGEAAGFARLYAVPNMGHCVGGLTVDRFDAFGALVDWVEHAKPPAILPAGPGRDSPWEGRSRPLCPYPAEARYRGQGDPEAAESFECRKPG